MNNFPAFPVHAQCGEESGMSMRDYFAAKAMAALICEPPWMEGASSLVNEWRTKGEMGPAQFASSAYKMADAMLKERAK